MRRWGCPQKADHLSGADGKLFTFVDRIGINAKIRQWIKSVPNLEFVPEIAEPIIKDDGEMKVDPRWAGGISGVVALVAQQGSCRDKGLRRPGWEFGSHEGVALRICHMGIVGPNLATGVKWIMGVADDHR
jgi:hypothetical protein